MELRLRECLDDPARLGSPSPRGRGAAAVWVSVGPQVGGCHIGPDCGGVFGHAAAVLCVGCEGRLSLIPKEFASGFGGNFLNASGDAVEVQALAVRGVAEIEAFGFVAAAHTDCIGPGCDGHGLQSFITVESAALAGESGGNVGFDWEVDRL